MDKIIITLLENVGFSPMVVLLLIIVAFMFWYMLNRTGTDTKYIDNAVKCLEAVLEEQRLELQSFSKTVYTIRTELANEKERSLNLKEEVLELRIENQKLKKLVEELELLVKQLREENAILRGEKQEGEAV